MTINVFIMGQTGSTGDFWHCLPRNLSFAEESVVDNFSVSASYVKSRLQLSNRKKSNLVSLHESLHVVSVDEDAKISEEMTNETMDPCQAYGDPGHLDHDQSEGEAMTSPVSAESCGKHHSLDEVPPSNMFSEITQEMGIPLASSEDAEEGVFMDMMEDVESAEDCDDFSIDSINSPDICQVPQDPPASGDPLDLKPLQDAVTKYFESQTAPVIVSELHISRPLVTSVGISDRRHANLHLNVECQPRDCTDAKTADDDDIKHDDDVTPVTSDSSAYGDDDFEFAQPKLRKSSSLKTTKTPPGTPHRKKVVRFADVLGLDLESIKPIMNLDSPPRIPSSAFRDLHSGMSKDRKDIGKIHIAATFPQPSANPYFCQSVANDKVRLENSVIDNFSITGVVRVANIGFHKSVRVRYTVNNWLTYYDIGASYIQNSCDGPTDRFSFSIVAPKDFNIGCRLEFAVSYTVNGETYWDNNGGVNYSFECYAKSMPMANDDTWLHFL